ncbi:MAG: DUF4287 domain-containing protein [Mucilaginibacter sp.]|nr:DUF4287 domain-containing protein [Mucilaginibacter sp.]
MNLTAYFETIKKKTGKTLADFKTQAEQKGLMADGVLKPTVKATEVFNWLKDEYGLGRGHGMAIYHSLRDGLEY